MHIQALKTLSANPEEKHDNDSSCSSNGNKLHSMLSGTFLTPHKTEDLNCDLQQAFRNMIAGLSASKTPNGHYTEEQEPSGQQYTIERKIYVADSQSSDSSNMFESPFQQLPKKIQQIPSPAFFPTMNPSKRAFLMTPSPLNPRRDTRQSFSHL